MVLFSMSVVNKRAKLASLQQSLKGGLQAEDSSRGGPGDQAHQRRGRRCRRSRRPRRPGPRHAVGAKATGRGGRGRTPKQGAAAPGSRSPRRGPGGQARAWRRDKGEPRTSPSRGLVIDILTDNLLSSTPGAAQIKPRRGMRASGPPGARSCRKQAGGAIAWSWRGTPTRSRSGGSVYPSNWELSTAARVRRGSAR